MNLLLRADGSIAMGTGHIMRCIALAQAWQDRGGSVSIGIASSTPALEAWLREAAIQVYHLAAEPGGLDDAQITATLAHQLDSPWVVVDGYQFDAAYQRSLKAAGLKLLFLDDYGHADHYAADWILNQNISASASLYLHREPYTQLLLGNQYALLRREFCQWIGWQRPIPPTAHRVLVTLGGADPDNVTLKVIRALQPMGMELEALVVVGGSNPHLETIQTAIATSPSIQLVQNVTNMPERMAWADLAVAAGGSTSWELALMGLPTLVIVVAENQRLIAETLDIKGVGRNLGWHEEVKPATIAASLTELSANPVLRHQLSQQGQMLIDGKGAERIIDLLTDL